MTDRPLADLAAEAARAAYDTATKAATRRGTDPQRIQWLEETAAYAAAAHALVAAHTAQDAA
ncbi:hypothetical protein ACF09H_41005 [Streptomyces sp. NPDC014983]|uniref:hypothetical protein n=1 Tax=Streptomyces sp. NPDC014983 TaxID=3364933 RepID=UPI0036F58952